jgi:hypothetical protein
MNRIFLWAVMAFFLWNCQTKKEENSASDSGENNALSSGEKTVYSARYQNPTGDFLLNISWINDDSVQFLIESKKESCPAKYEGLAVNLYPDADPEIAEDENGEAYPVVGYMLENQIYIIKIQMSLEKDRAKITIQDQSDPDSECLQNQEAAVLLQN